jgi:methyl-accepting chemotaxis protein
MVNEISTGTEIGGSPDRKGWYHDPGTGTKGPTGMAGGQHLQQVYADPSPTEYGEHTFLGGMSLGGRARLFVFLGLFALGGMAGGGWYLDQRLGQAVDEVSRARELLEIAGKVERGIWRMRDDERGLLVDGAPVHAERYDIQAAAVMGALEALVVRPDALALGDRLKAIGEALGRHGAEFKDTLAATKAPPSRNEPENLPALVDKAGGEVEARVARTEFAGLKNLWQRVREQEQGIKAGTEEETQARIGKSIESFAQALAGAPVADREKRGIGDALAAYRMAVETALRGPAPAGKARGGQKLDKLFAEIGHQVDGLVSFAEERLLLAVQKEGTLRGLVRLSVAAGGVGTLLLLLLFGVIFMRSMASPLRRLAEIGPRLLAGDTPPQIPALGNHDEIGEVARTLAKMRADLGETPRLRRELDATKADLARQMEETGRLKRELEELGTTPPPPAAPPPPALEPPKEEELAAAEPAEPEALVENPVRLGKLWSGTLSTVSRDVALASQSVSDAAFEAERTGTMIRGLTFAGARLKDAEELIAAIADQANMLAFRGNLGDKEKGEGPRNLIVLSTDPRLTPGRDAKEDDQPPAARVEAIRVAARQMKEALRDVGEAVGEIKSAAMDLAETTSEEALEVTTRLMEQSQFLRNMLDELVGKIHSRDDGSLTADQPPLLPSRRSE